MLVSRFVVFFWACFMGGLLAILNAASVNVYWLAIWPGVVTSGEQWLQSSLYLGFIVYVLVFRVLLSMGQASLHTACMLENSPGT